MGAGGLKEEGLTNFLPLKRGRGGVIREGGLIWIRGLIEDLQWYSFMLCWKSTPWSLVNEIAVSLLHKVWADGYKIMKRLISSMSVCLLHVMAKKCHFTSVLLCAADRRTDESSTIIILLYPTKDVAFNIYFAEYMLTCRLLETFAMSWQWRKHKTLELAG